MPPDPPNTGERIRLKQVSELLHEFAEVRWMALSTGSRVDRPQDTGENAEPCAIVEKRSTDKLSGAMGILLKGEPLRAGFYFRKNGSEHIRRECAEWRPDAVMAFTVKTLSTIPSDLPCPLVVDYIDALSEYFRSRALLQTNPLERILDQIESRRFRHAEQSSACSAALTFVTTAADHKWMGEHRNCAVLPNYVTEFRSPQAVLQDLMPTYNLVYFGELTGTYSATGIEFLKEQVMPEIWRTHPHAKLLLIGSNASDWVKSIVSDRIILVGPVKGIADAFAPGDVAVCPVFMGTGIKNKVIQSMALSVPNVVTSRANLGIGANPGESVAVSDDPVGFAREVISLWNVDRYRAMTSSAYDFVRSRFTREQCRVALEEPLRNMLARVR